jgi:undecaprenyl-diphosphatase
MNQLIVFVAQYMVLLLPLLIIVIFLRLPKDKRMPFIIKLAASGALSLIGIVIASHLVYDPRPFVSENIIPLFPHAPDNGFPSDHMTLSATLAFISYVCSKKIGLVMILIAAAIGTARVLAHVHSWADIFGGIIVALLSTLLAIYITRYITNKWLPSQPAPITK